MGRCGCSSVDTCGCRFASSSSIAITGLGTSSSPFVLALAAGHLQTITCTSSTRPSSPEVGQVIFETNTGLLRVWDGSWWRALSERQYEHNFVKENFSSAAIVDIFLSGSFAGSLDYPFRMTVEAAVTAGYTGVDGTIAHVYVDSPSGTGIWQPLGNTGVVEFNQRGGGKWEHAYIRGYRDYPAGGTPSYVMRADCPTSNAYLRGSMSVRLIPLQLAG